ncbi:hypothetical protein RRG08_004615 [Elysia crispata]|uniref:Uncharacterized protein n=1 Tax=Elysia crispata TaxID=231223 RepID=A0AAE0YA46_9GAST|nr:hypothetical protein RRG08_004615 [Elysia crispata]
MTCVLFLKVVTSNVQNTTTENPKSQFSEASDKKVQDGGCVPAALKFPKWNSRALLEKIRKDGILKNEPQVMCKRDEIHSGKPQAVPAEEDVSKPRAFILNEMQKLSDDELMKWDHHDFVKMRNLIVSRLTMFNVREEVNLARLTPSGMGRDCKQLLCRSSTCSNC